MASNPDRRKRARTLFLRVPLEDWAAVSLGFKTEFRTRPECSPNLPDLRWLPGPVVAYKKHGSGRGQSKLMVLEERRVEPLFALTEDPEGVGREGFASYEEFRRYWRRRNGGIYKPLEMVAVHRIRPFTPEDVPVFAEKLFTHLYGDWL